MARRSSGRRSRSGSRSASSSSTLRNPPQQVKSAPTPAPAPAQGNKGGSFLGVIADGIGWGAGTSIGHRAVDSIFGPRVVKHETVATPTPETVTPAAALNANSLGNSEACGGQSKALTDCLNSYGSDIGKCQYYMDMLKECRKSSGFELNA